MNLIGKITNPSTGEKLINVPLDPVYLESIGFSHSEIAELVINCENETLVTKVRGKCQLLLGAADIALNKANDKGESDTDIRVYRKALRDINKVFANDLANIVWPVKPF